MQTPLNDPKTLRGWMWYDWANSAFTLTITTVIFPIYYEAVTKGMSIAQGLAESNQYFIELLGVKVLNTSAYTFTVSFGFLLVAILGPFLSGIADYGGLKKRMMRLFVTLGSLGCFGLYFFTAETLPFALFCFWLGILGYAGSLVFYNAFLPEIATEDQYDKVSARGYSFGYIGSVLLLIFNLLTVLKLEWFFPLQAEADRLQATGLSAAEALKEARGYFEGLASRLCFVSVGLWWLGFSQITFRRMPKEQALGKPEGLWRKGFGEIRKVFGELKQQAELKRYLISYFFMSMGVQTIMYVATLFGSSELHMSTDKLIATLLLIQLIAGPGAWLYARWSGRVGNIRLLQLTTVLWMGVCVAAYFVQHETQFYIIAAMVGFVMGGTQSLLRSTYAKLIPDATPNHASYFSFYEFSEKIAIVLGTFFFALINEITGGMRPSALSLAGYFILSLIFLAMIRNFRIHKG